jgi:hypothetical protein
MARDRDELVVVLCGMALAMVFACATIMKSESTSAGDHRDDVHAIVLTRDRAVLEIVERATAVTRRETWIRTAHGWQLDNVDRE